MVKKMMDTNPQEKQQQHAFVIRGLDSDPTPEDVKEALENEHSMIVHKVYRMRSEYTPLFMITTPKNVTLAELKRSISVILHQKISWEMRRNDKKIVPCHRCQKWGQVKSLKCALGDWTRDCKKSRDTDATCANCGGPHPANYAGCEVYQKRLSAIEERRMQQKPGKKSFREASPPKENTWEKRRSHNKIQENPQSPKIPTTPTLSTVPNVPDATGEGMSENSLINLFNNQNNQNLKIYELIRFIMTAIQVNSTHDQTQRMLYACQFIEENANNCKL
ncbi:hypothetical protein JTB14_014417 [Gonioctena quinquepunctata]|nr:hypothetical protein JTB14_014417 [Gonioctena quinquepunctata]